MRTPFHISLTREMESISNVVRSLLDAGYNAGNSVVVTVSTDYSSIAGQIIRHELTHQEEIAEGFGVDVPYPDQVWDQQFTNEACSIFLLHRKSIGVKNIILVEAGVIRGSNYRTLIDLRRGPLEMDNNIITTALFENSSSAFKSDYVASYYNDTFNDLTFWWEKDNKHWK